MSTLDAVAGRGRQQWRNYEGKTVAGGMGCACSDSITLSCGVVVVAAVVLMKPMKDLRGCAVGRVALCGEAEGGARNFGGGGGKGAGAL